MEGYPVKTVLVTGADGFIGKNLCVTLEGRDDIRLLKYDIHNTMEQLQGYLVEADILFHLAGVNRPKDISEFDEGNRGFTETILDFLEQKGLKPTLVLSSSIQAVLPNPYGVSKKAAEDSVLDWSRRSGGQAYVFRLPNVFGKWCRPNYNSVVATFCHNIARGIPIRVDDPRTKLTLVYIDDVVQEMINCIDGHPNQDGEGYCHVPRTFVVTLQQLADTIYSFARNRETLMMPDLQEDFNRFMYAAYTSYLPEDRVSYELHMKHDNRGWLAEFIKSEQSGQVFVSRTIPGITRGNHWHHTKVEKFLVIYGEGLIKLRRVDSTDVVEIRVSGDELRVVDIPAGYTHSITNVGEGDMITLFWADEVFDPKDPDTFYLEV